MILFPALPRIIAYHSVFEAPEPSLARVSPFVMAPVDFEAQVAYLARTFTCLTVADLVEDLVAGRPFPRRAIAISFDDGYANNVEHALPILKRYGVPATFYLVANFVGGNRLFWDHQLEAALEANYYRQVTLEIAGRHLKLDLTSTEGRAAALRSLLPVCRPTSNNGLCPLPAQVSAALGYPGPAVNSAYTSMSWAQARELVAAGMHIGTHTMAHTPITQMTRVEAIEDAQVSRATLRKEIGVDAQDFCYVGGFCDAASGDWVRAAGLRSATTIRGDFVDSACSAMYLPRMVMYSGDIRKFKSEVNGLRAGIRRALPRWIYALRGRQHPIGRMA